MSKINEAVIIWGNEEEISHSIKIKCTSPNNNLIPDNVANIARENDGLVPKSNAYVKYSLGNTYNRVQSLSCFYFISETFVKKYIY